MAHGGLVFEGPLPLRWQVHATTPAAAGGPGPEQQLANLRTLSNVLALEDLAVSRREEPPSGSASDLERVELKLNLILELIEQLVSTQTGMPPVVQLRLTPTSLGWRCAAGAAPPHAAAVTVQVFLHPGYPTPLSLFGDAHVTADPATDRAQVRIDLAEVGERVRESLEKFIFRQHRRQVAALRQARP